MNNDELRTIIEKHEKWLNGHGDGECANLCGVDLRGVDLRGVDLRCADMRGANLLGANLLGADLFSADLRGVNFCCIDMSYADMIGADLHGVNLRGVDLRGANLRGADLRDSDLRDADLGCAKLGCADLCYTNLYSAKNIPFIPMACPEKGSFTAWKKADRYIVKLLIPEDARRSSATGRICRCNKAMVLAIETLDGEQSALTEIASDYDSEFIYKVGETVEEPHFCEDRFNECAEGIHFFINRQEAVDYI
jgi:hypothetical protein